MKYFFIKYERDRWQGQVTLRAENKSKALEKFYEIVNKNEVKNVWIIG